MTSQQSFSDELVFAPEEPLRDGPPAGTWKILIVDDDWEVHGVTKLALTDFSFESKGLTFVSAMSRAEAEQAVAQNPDIAVILLDVVMEEEDAGLRFARRLRNDMKNTITRIILRTGQPGQAPERKVILDYDINDYRAKTELTAQRLFTAVVSALRAFRDLQFIEQTREELRVKNNQLESFSHQLESLVKERTRDLIIARDHALMAERAKGALLANTSHELRTPLNAIIGYSKLLIEQAQDEGQASLVDDMIKIRDAGLHLLQIINGILDLSKIESGKIDLTFENIAIRELVESVVGTLRPLAQQRKNELIVDCPADIGYFRSDLTRVRQTLFNLVGNANKFTKAGTITVKVSLQPGVGPGAKEERILFSIRDTGIGISPEQQELLFYPFVQADSSTTRKYGGTGLGLAISQRLCRLLGGEIRVQSALGQGSTFIVDLPTGSDAAHES